MYLTPKQRRGRVFLHWETWLGLLLAGLLAGLGSHVGQVFLGHPSICAAIGGAVGGYAFHLVTGYVRRRYYPASA
jgi:predicted lipid-binding transport protein (Tim44 family)